VLLKLIDRVEELNLGRRVTKANVQSEEAYLFLFSTGGACGARRGGRAYRRGASWGHVSQYEEEGWQSG